MKIAISKVRKAAEDLAEFEAERAVLDNKIKQIREALTEWMEVGEEVQVSGERKLVKRERVNWDISPTEVYAEVGPRKFVSYVKTVNIPKVRNDLGEQWLQKHADQKVSEYVTWA